VLRVDCRWGGDNACGFVVMFAGNDETSQKDGEIEARF
jgi:hypothetical protein